VLSFLSCPARVFETARPEGAGRGGAAEGGNGLTLTPTAVSGPFAVEVVDMAVVAALTDITLCRGSGFCLFMIFSCFAFADSLRATLFSLSLSASASEPGSLSTGTAALTALAVPVPAPLALPAKPNSNPEKLNRRLTREPPPPAAVNVIVLARLSLSSVNRLIAGSALNGADLSFRAAGHHSGAGISGASDFGRGAEADAASAAVKSMEPAGVPPEASGRAHDDLRSDLELVLYSAGRDALVGD